MNHQSLFTILFSFLFIYNKNLINAQPESIEIITNYDEKCPGKQNEDLTKCSQKVWHQVDNLKPNTASDDDLGAMTFARINDCTDKCFKSFKKDYNNDQCLAIFVKKENTQDCWFHNKQAISTIKTEHGSTAYILKCCSSETLATEKPQSTTASGGKGKREQEFTNELENKSKFTNYVGEVTESFTDKETTQSSEKITTNYAESTKISPENKISTSSSEKLTDEKPQTTKNPIRVTDKETKSGEKITINYPESTKISPEIKISTYSTEKSTFEKPQTKNPKSITDKETQSSEKITTQYLDSTKMSPEKKISTYSSEKSTFEKPQTKSVFDVKKNASESIQKVTKNQELRNKVSTVDDNMKMKRTTRMLQKEQAVEDFENL